MIAGMICRSICTESADLRIRDQEEYNPIWRGGCSSLPKGDAMGTEVAEIIKKAQERGNDNVLESLVYDPGDLETIRYVCSMDGEYAISPEEFLTQAAQASDEYEREDGKEENGFKYGSILPVDIALIHEDGTTDLTTDESECEQKWITVSVYHNSKEVSEDARTMSEKNRKAAETLIGASLDNVTGLGVWRTNDYNDMKEGSITPSELLNHMNAKNRKYLDGFAGEPDSGEMDDENDDGDEDEDEDFYPSDVEDLIRHMHYDFAVAFKDGTRVAVVPDGIDGDIPKKMPIKPKSDAKPFQPFHPWGSDGFFCSGESI